MTGAVARRYAKALFALAKEEQVLEQTAEQLQRMAALGDDPAIGPTLRSPLLSTERRRQLAQTLARDLSLSDLLTRFVGVLADQQRLDQLPAMAEYFQLLLDQELGQVRITMRSARTLDAQQQEQIAGAFARLTGKHVVPTLAVDPELLGGIVVEVGSKVYDGSVRTQLERLAKELGGTAVL
ncbi:MAG: ATP synthase F1 subunit delta [Candidatus Binatia bacterium]|jgi:F-type H+-transporting ATPase subunit delta